MDRSHYWIVIAISLAIAGAADAQVLQLTEWRAQIDYELARIPMTREAHGQVIAVLQAAEQRAQAEKMAKAKPFEPPKEGQ